MLVTHNAIILVIDGTKKILYRNCGKDFAADLEVLEQDAKPVPSTAALGTDKPGRSFKAFGSARSAYQSTDYHQSEEDRFVIAATEQLNILAQQSRIDFIVVAAPHVMGVIRKYYSNDLRKRIVTEIDKDYAGRTAADVAELLRRHEI